MEITEMKTTIYILKTHNGLNSRTKMAVEKVNKLEDKSIEFILSKKQRERKTGRKKNIQQTCGIVTKGLV